MKKLLKNAHGMSLTELVIVILIITGMVLGSIPAMRYLQNKRFQKEMNETVSLIQTTLKSIQSNALLQDSPPQFPTSLDDNAEGTVCTSCFNKLLSKGVENTCWHKISTTRYTLSTKCSSQSQTSKPSDKMIYFNYDSRTGTFMAD